MDETQMMLVISAVTAALALPKVKERLELSKAKHPSLAGHARMARRIASWIPYYEYDEWRFYDSDGAPADVVAKRRSGFTRLARCTGTRAIA